MRRTGALRLSYQASDNPFAPKGKPVDGIEPSFELYQSSVITFILHRRRPHLTRRPPHKDGAEVGAIGIFGFEPKFFLLPKQVP